jgi:hypothetical protein
MTSHEDQQRVSGGFNPDFVTIRRGAFYLSVIGVLAMYAVMMGDMLTFVFRGWFEEPGVHHFHELTMFGLIWLGILGLLVQLYRPDERVNAVLVSVLVMIPLAVIAVTTSSPIAMMPIIFGVIGLLVAALHPAGRSLLGFTRDVQGTRTLGGLLAIAALPLLIYAGVQLVNQYAIADDHAAFVHYGGMTMVAGVVLVMGILTIVRSRDRRFAAWSAGILAGYFGLASVLYPAQPSSPGVIWGALLIVWGGAFIVAFELKSGQET